VCCFNLFAASQLWVLDERRGLFPAGAHRAVQLTSAPIRWNTPIPSGTGQRYLPMVSSCEANWSAMRRYPVGFNPTSEAFRPNLSLSPDGQFVAYVTFPEGILWRANRDGSHPVPTWSSDSQFIYFVHTLDDPSVFRVRASGGNAERVVDLKGFRYTGRSPFRWVLIRQTRQC
jgi:eukaryotic-like serine/threonine-protein kinase